MMAGLEFVLDALLAVLLVAVIGYAVILNRKLSVLRESKEEFESLLETFGSTTEQAQANLASLREEAATVKASFNGELGEMEKSRAEVRSLADDLEYLVKRGEKLADRLAGGEGGPQQKASASRQAATEESEAQATGSAQQQFLRALQGVR